jgi:hypothetical protein
LPCESGQNDEGSCKLRAVQAERHLVRWE